MKSLELPPPRDEFEMVMDDGVPIVARIHGNARGTRLFFSHGNGFAADGYLPFWGVLLERFEVVVFDFRNHGRNGPSPAESHDYAHFIADLASVRRQVTSRLGARTSVGVFHSMSARAAMKEAVDTGFHWDALVLFEPANVPLRGHALYTMMVTFENKLVELAGRRRRRYDDPGELAREYAANRFHRRWVEGAHELMARAVLRREEDTGAWVLACRPQLEAAIYGEAMELDLWPAYGDYGGPVKLIGADAQMDGASASAVANRALASESDYVYEAIAGTGHLLQIEKPEACIGAMTSFLEDLGIAV
ncbi:MAG: alpha/beta hydrolase [Rhodospirillales bacterium]|jgi:pimeloyl-ACP methyl ester carboxylesterase|nr:alpha/beta hydrolase [Rhodospirillales bacterium]